MKTIAITGGTGFIGGTLAKALLAKGHKVIIFTRSLPKKQLPDARYSIVSFKDTESLKHAAEGADIIVHMAAMLFSRTKAGFELANVQGTANLVSAVAAQTKPPEKFIYVSSLAAGGPPPKGIPARNEAMPDAPISNYGASKLGGEKELQKLPAAIQRTILRPPIVYGKNEFAVSQIAAWVKKGFMVNAGKSTGAFSFVFVDDLVAAIITTMENPVTNSQTYYICEPKTYAWRNFIGLLAKAMGVKMPFVLDLPAPLLTILGILYEGISWLTGAEPVFNRDKAKEGAAGIWTADPSKWEKDTGYKTWTSLEEGIKKTFS